jgi:ATP-dependent Clp protease protease subunit
MNVFKLSSDNDDDDLDENIPFYTGDTYVKLTMRRQLFLNEDINEKSTCELMSMLLYLDSVSNDPITIFLNSPGGETFGFLGLYDIIKYIKSPIRTICTGSSASAAALLLSCGKKGERYAMKSAEIMIHGISFLFPKFTQRSITHSKTQLKELKEHEEMLFTILSNNTGQSLEKIKEDCKVDHYMTAKEAKEYGIIDHIL